MVNDGCWDRLAMVQWLMLATITWRTGIRVMATLCLATSRRETPEEVCDEGRGVGPHGQGVYLDFADAIQRLGLETVRDKYGNLFDIYERITGADAYTVPMRIYPAPHYTMGGLWVDYHLMSTIPGLFAGGEANFSDFLGDRTYLGQRDCEMSIFCFGLTHKTAAVDVRERFVIPELALPEALTRLKTLQSMSERTLATRKQESDKCHQLIEHHVQDFQLWIEHPVIESSLRWSTNRRGRGRAFWVV
jgi:succinate dehydrogenase/fumarate reductase flavoprotein subunit